MAGRSHRDYVLVASQSVKLNPQGVISSYREVTQQLIPLFTAKDTNAIVFCFKCLYPHFTVSGILVDAVTHVVAGTKSKALKCFLDCLKKVSPVNRNTLGQYTGCARSRIAKHKHLHWHRAPPPMRIFINHGNLEIWKASLSHSSRLSNL